MLANYWNGTKTLLFQLVSKHRPFTEIPKQEDKVAVVTGGNTGIGYETVRGLCKAGLSVIMACRSEEKANNAIKKLKDEQPEAKVKYMNLDLSSLSSVKEFARKFQESERELHILVNNAGIMLSPYGKTKDGFELQFGINHLGHFALTVLLLDMIKRSGLESNCARIVTVSSAAHFAGTINFEDIQSQKKYCPYQAYSQSKLANILFMYALQRRLTREGCHVTANALHPGVVNTDLFRYIPWIMRSMQGLMAKFIFRTPEQGASTSLFACLSPDLEGVGGKYLDNCQATSSIDESYNEDVQERLWDLSCKLTGVGRNDSKWVMNLTKTTTLLSFMTDMFRQLQLPSSE